MKRPRPLIIMGVAGCGKTTVGRAMAQATGRSFIDGDDLHDPKSRALMRAGTAMTDADRLPWLDRIAAALVASADITTCSALRRAQRDHLRAAVPHVRFAFLSVSEETARERVAGRIGHFFNAALVADQFRVLELPTADETDTITFDATLPLATVLAQLAS